MNCNLVLNLSSVLLHMILRKMFVIELFLLLGKCHIHQTKCSNSKPNFANFKTAFKMYFESVKCKKKIEKPKDLYLC